MFPGHAASAKGAGAGGGGGGVRGDAGSSDKDKKDAASLLLMSLNAFYNKEKETSNLPGSRRKYHRFSSRKAYEDEKSLCHHTGGDHWTGDLSLDQPNYGSVFLQLKEAKLESDNSCEFLGKAADIFGGTLLMTGILGVFMAVPVCMISIGVKYLNECPKQPKIPIYLLVGGCFGLLKLMSMLWKQVRSRRYERLDEIYDTDEDNGDVILSKSSKFSETLLSMFLFAWFILGNYWVLTIWKPHFYPLLHEPSNWCDETVYMFAFVQLMTCYGIMVLIILLTCILALCHRYSVAFEKS